MAVRCRGKRFGDEMMQVHPPRWEVAEHGCFVTLLKWILHLSILATLDFYGLQFGCVAVCVVLRGAKLPETL